MKELELRAPEPVKMHAQQSQEKQLKHIGRVRKIKGLTLWELNVVTGLVQQAKYEDVVVNYNHNTSLPSIKRKLIIQENCIYAQALNLENAIRKLKAKLELLKVNSK